jgi:hypothetical protein
MYSALLLCGILISAVNEASAADLAPAPPPVPDSQVIAASPWTFRFVPYG